MIAILADDLSGAADTAQAFWEHGFAAFIQLHAAVVPTREEPVAVAVDTSSRHLSAGEAAHRVESAVHALRALGASRFYKKIDSTLRGNLGAELQATLKATGASLAVVCPAFPAQGRTVAAGRVRVKGIDLMDTETATVSSSRVLDAIAAQAPSLPVAELAPETPRPAKGIAVVDAQSDADLHAWVRRFGAGPDVLWVGSAGLAAAVAAALSAGQGRPQHDESPARDGQPVLVVVGSANPASLDQIQALRRLSRVSPIGVPAEVVARGELPAWLVAGQVLQVFQNGDDCLLYARGSQSADGGVARWLGTVAATAAERWGRHLRLVLTGGDTARAALEPLGLGTLEVMGAVAAGVPLCESLEGRMRIVTKAGGFGEPDILVRAVQVLR